MSWIKIIEENEATGELAEIYQDIIRKRGKLSNIMKIHSLNPQSMKDHMNLYIHLMFGKSGLSRSERELIGVVVSSTNQCQYCIHHHAEALLFYWKDERKIQSLIENFREVDLTERERAIAEYAEALTLSPSTMNETHILQLRKAGFTDEEILDINLITSYFNFVNRIVMGLGVEFNYEEMRGYKY